MEIRILNVDDIGQFWQLRLRGLLEEPESFGRSYAEEIDRPYKGVVRRFMEEWSIFDNFILGIFQEGKLMGYVGFARENMVKLKHKGRLWGAYVVPEARGKGFGKMLISEAIKRSKLLGGVERINLVVVSNNVAAKNLYINLGFKVYGIEKRALKVNGIYLDEDYMVLDFME